MQNYLASDKEEEQGGGIYGYCVCHMGEVITMNRENDIFRVIRLIQQFLLV